MPYLSASAVVIHYEEALYQVYAPLPLLYLYLPSLLGRLKIPCSSLCKRVTRVTASSGRGTVHHHNIKFCRLRTYETDKITAAPPHQQWRRQDFSWGGAYRGAEGAKRRRRRGGWGAGRGCPPPRRGRVWVGGCAPSPGNF